MNVHFLKRKIQVLKYSMGGASHSDVNNLLAQLASPKHTQTRWGSGKVDRNFRAAVSDSLRDNGRDHEADLLADPQQHVIVHDGQVHKGRSTTRHVVNLINEFVNQRNEPLGEPLPSGTVAYLDHQDKPVGFFTHGAPYPGGASLGNQLKKAPGHFIFVNPYDGSKRPKKVHLSDFGSSIAQMYRLASQNRRVAGINGFQELTNAIEKAPVEEIDDTHQQPTQPNRLQRRADAANMNVHFLKRKVRALKYSMGGASESDVTNLLGQLASPEHNHTRWGSEGGDIGFRNAVSDSLRDNGREQEADLLANPRQHVIVQHGQVHPGRFNTRLVQNAVDRLHDSVSGPEDTLGLLPSMMMRMVRPHTNTVGDKHLRFTSTTVTDPNGNIETTNGGLPEDVPHEVEDIYPGSATYNFPLHNSVVIHASQFPNHVANTYESVLRQNNLLRPEHTELLNQIRHSPYEEIDNTHNQPTQMSRKSYMSKKYAKRKPKVPPVPHPEDENAEYGLTHDEADWDRPLIHLPILHANVAEEDWAGDDPNEGLNGSEQEFIDRERGSSKPNHRFRSGDPVHIVGGPHEGKSGTVDYIPQAPGYENYVGVQVPDQRNLRYIHKDYLKLNEEEPHQMSRKSYMLKKYALDPYTSKAKDIVTSNPGGYLWERSKKNPDLPGVKERTPIGGNKNLAPSLHGTKLAVVLQEIRDRFGSVDPELKAMAEKALSGKGDYKYNTPSNVRAKTKEMIARSKPGYRHPEGQPSLSQEPIRDTSSQDLFTAIRDKLTQHGRGGTDNSPGSSDLATRAGELARSYNWHRVGAGLQVDEAVRDYINKVTGDRLKGANEAARSVHNLFGLGSDQRRQGKVSDSTYNAFWSGLRKHINERAKGGESTYGLTAKDIKDDMLHKSIRRLAEAEEHIYGTPGKAPTDPPHVGPSYANYKTAGLKQLGPNAKITPPTFEKPAYSPTKTGVRVNPRARAAQFRRKFSEETK